MNENSHMEFLVRKFVDDKLSGDELEILQNYLKTPEGLKVLEKVMNEHHPAFIEEEVPLLKPSTGFSQQKTRRLSPIHGIAASIIGVLIIGALYWYVNQEPELVHFQTLAGQTLDVILPDQSKVTLNSQSTLSFEKDWSKATKRRVTLVGEGYFKVVHDPEMPFLVSADGVTIKVLGTTFDVKSYHNDKAVETTLVEGRVVVEDQTKGEVLAELRPNQKAVYNKDERKISLQDATSAVETSWTNGVLVFEDKPFGEIIKILERRYGVVIEVSNETSLQCKFNATIESESLAEVLKLFASIGTMKYEMRGSDRVLIEGTVCGV